MKISTIISVSLAALGFATWTVDARADSTHATCEVRKDGDKQQGRSGPCTFSQRQGYIDIDLKNGDTVSLSPGNKADRYKDQHGNKVVRSSTGTTGMSLKWDNGKHINVTWSGNSYGGSHNNSYGSGGSGSSEYQRGYNDGMRGSWDQDKHNQQYKDGYSAGEAARGSGHGGGKNSGLSHGDYGINQLGNGQFEVVWSKPFCSVLIASDGNIRQTTEDCTNEQINRSREIGRHER